MATELTLLTDLTVPAAQLQCKLASADSPCLMYESESAGPDLGWEYLGELS